MTVACPHGGLGPSSVPVPRVNVVNHVTSVYPIDRSVPCSVVGPNSVDGNITCIAFYAYVVNDAIGFKRRRGLRNIRERFLLENIFAEKCAGSTEIRAVSCCLVHVPSMVGCSSRDSHYLDPRGASFI